MEILNRKARYDYEVLDKYEVGIVLTGTEIKSIRNGKVNLKDSFANIKNGECFAIGIHISPYEFGNIFNKDPLRDRKLLLNKSEISNSPTIGTFLLIYSFTYNIIYNFFFFKTKT